MGASKKPHMTMLDSIVILLAAATLTVFLLWAGAEMSGAPTFKALPDFLKEAAGSVFTVITAGSVGTLLAVLLRRQILGTAMSPNYLPWVIGTALLFCGVVVGLAKISPEMFKSREQHNTHGDNVGDDKTETTIIIGDTAKSHQLPSQ